MCVFTSFIADRFASNLSELNAVKTWRSCRRKEEESNVIYQKYCETRNTKSSAALNQNATEDNTSFLSLVFRPSCVGGDIYRADNG